jgi:peptide/nickel transport system ATP-binding protein
MTEALLKVIDLKKHFAIEAGLFTGSRSSVRAVDGLSFEVARGETLALVGESGCGKSTVGRAVLALFAPTAGEVVLAGSNLGKLPPAQLRQLRRRIQVVFQDPYSSLNPRMKVGEILAEPIRNFKLARSAEDVRSRVSSLIDRVHLPKDAINRFPHEFSGGQRQRIGIARALATEPDLLVCDEAVSALDVSVKAQIINLLQDLQSELGLAMLFISHDLSIVEHMAHRVAVMYLGKIVEIAPRNRLFGAAQHPYSKALLSSVPVPMPGRQSQRIVLKGDVPSPVNPPNGCRFHTRCPFASDLCRYEEPTLREHTAGHWTACHLLGVKAAELAAS